MQKLQEMLNLNLVENISTQVEVTNRFLKDDKTPFYFTIKPISFQSLNELKKRATYIDKHGRHSLNEDLLNTLIIIESTTDPNFKDSLSIEKTGCSTPEQYLNKTLLAGEIDRLIKAILKISGFENDLEEMVVDIKN